MPGFDYSQREAVLGGIELVYKYTVSGSDKASIDTGVDAAQAGTNDWTNCDLLEFYVYGRTDEAAVLSQIKFNFNNDTSAHYDWQWMRNLDTAFGSFDSNGASNITTQTAGASMNSSNSFGMVKLEMVNPSAAFWKPISGFGSVQDSGSGATSNFGNYLYSATFRSTSAVTRVAIAATTAGKNLKVGSQLLVYKRISF